MPSLIRILFQQVLGRVFPLWYRYYLCRVRVLFLHYEDPFVGRTPTRLCGASLSLPALRPTMSLGVFLYIG